MLIFSVEARKRMRERLMIYHESLCIADIAKNRRGSAYSQEYDNFTVYWDLGRYVLGKDGTVITIMLRSTDDNQDKVRSNNKKQKFIPISFSEKEREDLYNIIFT